MRRNSVCCLVDSFEGQQVVCLCRLADYADRGVTVLVGGVGTAGWSA
jgi:hypothetical protein